MQEITKDQWHAFGVTIDTRLHLMATGDLHCANNLKRKLDEELNEELEKDKGNIGQTRKNRGFVFPSDLPKELQLLIVSFIDSPTDIYHLSLSCRSMHKFVRNNRRNLAMWDMELTISPYVGCSFWNFDIRPSRNGIQRSPFDDSRDKNKVNSLGLKITTRRDLDTRSIAVPEAEISAMCNECRQFNAINVKLFSVEEETILHPAILALFTDHSLPGGNMKSSMGRLSIYRFDLSQISIDQWIRFLASFNRKGQKREIAFSHCKFATSDFGFPAVHRSGLLSSVSEYSEYSAVSIALSHPTSLIHAVEEVLKRRIDARRMDLLLNCKGFYLLEVANIIVLLENWLIDDKIVGESDYLHVSLVVDFVFRNEASRVFAQLVDHFKVVGQFLILAKPNRRSMLFAFIAPLKSLRLVLIGLPLSSGTRDGDDNPGGPTLTLDAWLQQVVFGRYGDQYWNRLVRRELRTRLHALSLITAQDLQRAEAEDRDGDQV